MHFIVRAIFTDDAARVRERPADAFGAYLRDAAGHPDVIVHHGGPTLGDDGEADDGLVLVVEAPSPDAVRAFVADSPYGAAGLLAETRVRRWNWLTGRPGQASG